MSCPHCGSWAVRSDRSLAGRLVCGRCGQPLTGAAPSRRSRPGNGLRGSGQRRRPDRSWQGSLAQPRWGLLLLVLLTAAWLAAQPKTPRPSPALPSLPPGSAPIRPQPSPAVQG